MKTMNWFECEYPTDRSLACGWVAPNQCQGRREKINPYRLGGGWYGGQPRYAVTETECVEVRTGISMKMLAQKLNG